MVSPKGNQELIQTLQTYLTQEAISVNSDLTLRDRKVGNPTLPSPACKVVHTCGHWWVCCGRW
jgi:hypothetical protein